MPVQGGAPSVRVSSQYGGRDVMFQHVHTMSLVQQGVVMYEYDWEAKFTVFVHVGIFEIRNVRISLCISSGP